MLDDRDLSLSVSLSGSLSVSRFTVLSVWTGYFSSGSSHEQGSWDASGGFTSLEAVGVVLFAGWEATGEEAFEITAEVGTLMGDVTLAGDVLGDLVLGLLVRGGDMTVLLDGDCRRIGDVTGSGGLGNWDIVFPGWFGN